MKTEKSRSAVCNTRTLPLKVSDTTWTEKSVFDPQRSVARFGVGLRGSRTSFRMGGIIVPHSGVVSVLPGIVGDDEPRGLEEAGELAGDQKVSGWGLCLLQRGQVPCPKSRSPSGRGQLMGWTFLRA